MTFNFTLVGTTIWTSPEPHTSLHIFDQPQIEIAWVVGEVQGFQPAHQLCVAGACSSVWGPAKHSWSDWLLMSRGDTSYTCSWNRKMWWKKMIVSDESTYCLFATRPTRMWGVFLEKNSTRSGRIWQWSIFWRSWFGAAWLVVKLDIVDGTVNVTKCISTLLKCVELSA